MTAKQALLDYIETLSEDDARSVWERIQANAVEVREASPLTAREIEEITRGLHDIANGRVSTLEEVERELGLRA